MLNHVTKFSNSTAKKKKIHKKQIPSVLLLKWMALSWAVAPSVKGLSLSAPKKAFMFLLTEQYINPDLSPADVWRFGIKWGKCARKKLRDSLFPF